MSVLLDVVLPFEKSKAAVERLVKALNDDKFKTFHSSAKDKVTVNSTHPVFPQLIAFEIKTKEAGISAVVKVYSHIVRVSWSYPAEWHNTFGNYSRENEEERRIVRAVCRELGAFLQAKECVYYRDFFLPEVADSFGSFVKTLEKEGKVGLLSDENLEELKSSGGCDNFSSFIEHW